MNPLEAVLRPIANVLNRNIRETTPARELCDKLEDTVIAVRVRNTALAMWFIVQDGVLELTTDHDGEPDVLISGSLVTLARMSGDAGLEALRDGSLELTGDAHKAERFQRLLAFAKPDVEEELSSVVGDAAAHRLGYVQGVDFNHRPRVGGRATRQRLPDVWEILRLGPDIELEIIDNITQHQA